MQPGKTFNQQITTARQLEKDSRLSDAAAIYQKIFNSDPANQEIIARLLVLYRKLKEYRKELAVLNDAIAAFQQRQKATRKKWIETHPKAANAGKSMLRQLEKGGNALMGLGEGPLVDRWMKRRDLVIRRLTGKKPPAASTPKKTASIVESPADSKPKKTKKAVVRPTVQKAIQKKAEAARRRQKVAREKQLQREEAAAARKIAAQQRSESLARQKREERERMTAETWKKLHPSLFIIVLRYIVPLEKIDAAMKQHVAYLDQHFDNGDFLVAGRQTPRTGGIILARAEDRDTMEKITKQDPFIKRKLATADIIEFTASKTGKGLQKWLKGVSR